jgi:NAD(P)-dependent dehydrogenase (short-subunit alcohol dehydrogenase family)
MRLKDRVAIVVGAGQSPGEGMGNGRATALTFAREGAHVLCVDHNLESAQETVDMTVDMIGAKRGAAVAFRADVTKNAELKAMVDDAHARWGRIDILHNNVGVSLAGGDAELLDITEEALDRCVAINLKSCIFAARHVIPIMRAQMSGAIINISSMAAITTYPYVAYKATKSAMIAFTEQLAYQNAIRHPRQRHPARPDEHADGGRYPRPRIQEEPRRGRGRARRQGTAAPEDGHRVGRRQRGPLPGLGRGQFHHRRDAAGGRRRERAKGVGVKPRNQAISLYEKVTALEPLLLILIFRESDRPGRPRPPGRWKN